MIEVVLSIHNNIKNYCSENCCSQALSVILRSHMVSCHLKCLRNKNQFRAIYRNLWRGKFNHMPFVFQPAAFLQIIQCNCIALFELLQFFGSVRDVPVFCIIQLGSINFQMGRSIEKGLKCTRCKSESFCCLLRTTFAFNILY